MENNITICFIQVPLFLVKAQNRFFNTSGVDGAKQICMDGLYWAVKEHTCLVYSFGLANDWKFEELISSLGCKVRLVIRI